MVQRFGEIDPSYAEYILGRHARAEHNVVDGIATFAGGRVDSKLTERGISEIETVVEKIAKDGGCEILAHSWMARSRQTAEIIAEHLERLMEKSPAVVELKDLQEVDVGEFTGHTGAWAKANYPEEANEFYHGDIQKWRFPGGENYQDLVIRVYSVIKQLREITQPKQKVVIIGHGMFDRAFLSVVMPDRKDIWGPIDIPHDLLIAFQAPDKIIVE